MRAALIMMKMKKKKKYKKKIITKCHIFLRNWILRFTLAGAGFLGFNHFFGKKKAGTNINEDTDLKNNKIKSKTETETCACSCFNTKCILASVFFPLQLELH